jgi:hypothetical protein
MTGRTYDHQKNKPLASFEAMDPNVECISQDAVRCYREIYEVKKKQTVQTKFSMFLIKKTSPTSTQEHDPDMYCTVSLSKR